MILNHSRTIRSVISLLCISVWYLEHGRDITLLIVLLCIMDYSNLFQYSFYPCAMVPTLVENSKFFHVLVLYTEESVLLSYTLVEGHVVKL